LSADKGVRFPTAAGVGVAVVLVAPGFAESGVAPGVAAGAFGAAAGAPGAFAVARAVSVFEAFSPVAHPEMETAASERMSDRLSMNRGRKK
jgi:hypothetical protein